MEGEMMENKVFADRIRDLRLKKGMTQQKLGNVVGVTSTGISYWESGKAIPNFETLKKISNYFGVSIDYLSGKDNATDNEKGMILFRKAEQVNDKDKDRLYNIIESTIDIFLDSQDDKSGKKN